jgi:predicted esterase YcpF (UPF0227 family)
MPTPLATTLSPTHVLYLHGFKSSPQSMKAQRVGAWLATHRPEVQYACPRLPPSPRIALEQVLASVAHWPRERMAVLGSSLGGFYATVVAETLGCHAVVMNPVVHAARDALPFVGEHSHWHDPEDRFTFHPAYVDELRNMTPGPLNRLERYTAIIATGDEVLDWREMAERYAGARQMVIEGSDHAISDFDAALAFLLQSLALTR